MMRILCLCLFVTLLYAACTNQYKVPGDIIPKEKMEKVLWDMLLADRFASSYIAKDSSKNLQEENFKLYEQVFGVHDITREEFVKSFKYYLTRPDITMVVLDSLSAEATRKREDIYKGLITK